MRLGFERAAQLAMVLGVVALVRKHGLDPGHPHPSSNPVAVRSEWL
jgi:hypothetical protein